MKISFLAENNIERVILKDFDKYDGDDIRLISYIKTLSDSEIKAEIAENQNRFSQRHRFYQEILTQMQEKLSLLPAVASLSNIQKEYLSHYYVHEYSIEAAALFNPSIVPSPHNENEYILSYRATGEGHISSITWSSIHYEKDQMSILKRSSLATLGETKSEKNGEFSIEFSPESELSERVIFPTSGNLASKGFEDLRFVYFSDENKYRGHFTAYDGQGIYPFILETEDFLSFQALPMNGREAINKNFAFFPKKINGKYALIGRQDGYSNFYLTSSSLTQWDEKKELLDNRDLGLYTSGYMGNCGSPIETNKGWLLPIHGVASFRRYTLGFVLLDLDDPSKVIARSDKPFLEPNEEQREGYVPNVLYSCGACVHDERTLLLPFAASDYNCYIAEINLSEIWKYLRV